MDDVSREFRVAPAVVREWEDGTSHPPSHVTRSLTQIQNFAGGEGPIAKLAASSIADDLKAAKRTSPIAALLKDDEVKARRAPPSRDDLIKSKQRVADHGEVFTPPWLVEKMLDLVKGESERIDSRFLEPACGSGNFLVAVLQRKLASVEAKYGNQGFNKKLWALQALACCYGIELLADNIAECRSNMLEVFAQYLSIDSRDDFYRAASHVLSLNLIHGDAMTMNDAGGGPIMIVEWTYLKAGKFNRRDFRLEVLTQASGFSERWAAPDTEQKVSLFGEPRPSFHHRGRDPIFQPIASYPPMSVAEMAEKDVGAV